MTAVGLVRALAAELRRSGWRRGFDGDEGPCCLLVAAGRVRQALGGGPYLDTWPLTVTGPIYRALRELDAGTDSVMRWNDAPGRTAEEVFALLARAEELALADAGGRTP